MVSEVEERFATKDLVVLAFVALAEDESQYEYKVFFFRLLHD
jgi:hypothetical protein